MSELKIERHKYKPTFPDEIEIIDKRKNEEFIITLSNGEEIEISFNWDYGYGGRGTEQMYIPIKLLRGLLNELGI